MVRSVVDRSSARARSASRNRAGRPSPAAAACAAAAAASSRLWCASEVAKLSSTGLRATC